jgi:hypothetical protein
MDDRDQQIREIAYFLWLEEGCPEGRADQHWAAAEALLNAQDAEPEQGAEPENEGGDRDPRGEALSAPAQPPARPMDAGLARRRAR